VGQAEAEAAAAEAARALSSAPGSPASLEALHSLLFLLPLCAPLRNPAPPWAAHAQRGLAALLSNQLPSQQRAMALRAAASAVRSPMPPDLCVCVCVCVLGRGSGRGGLTREVETPLPSNSPHDHMLLRVNLVGSHV
jgi:hypothetical protein